MGKVELPKDLKKSIVLSIRKEEYAYARRYMFTASLLGVVSFVGGLFSLRYVLQGFAQSSFYSYASLLLSDPDVLLQYWREFTLSLVETMPLFGITALFITIALLLLSVRIFTSNMQSRFAPRFSH